MNNDFGEDDSLDINLIEPEKMIYEAKDQNEHLATEG